MQISIRYALKGGHTRALAQALASALGIKAELAGVPVEDADVLFVGSAVYAYGIDPSVKQLILGSTRPRCAVSPCSATPLWPRAGSMPKSSPWPRDGA